MVFLCKQFITYFGNLPRWVRTITHSKCVIKKLYSKICLAEIVSIICLKMDLLFRFLTHYDKKILSLDNLSIGNLIF